MRPAAICAAEHPVARRASPIQLYIDAHHAARNENPHVRSGHPLNMGGVLAYPCDDLAAGQASFDRRPTSSSMRNESMIIAQAQAQAIVMLPPSDAT